MSSNSFSSDGGRVAPVVLHEVDQLEPDVAAAAAAICVEGLRGTTIKPRRTTPFQDSRDRRLVLHLEVVGAEVDGEGDHGG